MQAPKPRFLVVCEGSVSEPQYIKKLCAYWKISLVDVEVVPGVGVPLTIVKKAKDRKVEAEKRAKTEEDQNLAFDEVLGVFDVDEHPSLSEAKDMARANDIRLAISNPCFELCLLLHFRDSPGGRHRHDVQRLLKEHSSTGKHIDMAALIPGYHQADVRAEQLAEDAEKMNEAGRNPTTEVFRLIRLLRPLGSTRLSTP